MASPAVTLTGTIRDISGNPIAGAVTATLGNFGGNAPTISGDSELAPIQVSATANGSGVWSLTLWGADQISPINTTYTISITPAGSAAVLWIAEYQIKSGSYNLANLTPLISLPPQSIPTGPAGPTGATGAAGATGTITANTGATIGGPLVIQGPGPMVDVKSYGARSVTVAPQTTATTNGTNSIVVASASGFQIGDGITIRGAGTSNAMSTPGTPTITNDLLSGAAMTGLVVADNGAGTSTYNYVVVARSKYGSLTAASATGTTSTGQSSLGLQTANVNSMTRSNDTVTVVTASTTGLTAGTLIQLTVTASGALNSSFNGWYKITTITNGTTFVLNRTSTDTRAQGWLINDPTSISGSPIGTVAWYQVNHITWAAVTGAFLYYVYAQRPGDSALKLIGQTYPSGLTNGYIVNSFDDLGSPYLDSQTFPSYVPTAPPVTATNDFLSTTITNIVGTTLTLANAATQSASGLTAIFDSTPCFLNAMNAASQSIGSVGGSVLISANATGKFFINSWLDVPAGITVWQGCTLVVNETIGVSRSVNWFGDYGSNGENQFSFNSSAVLFQEAGNPCLYVYGPGNIFRNLSLENFNTNGGQLLVIDNADISSFEFVSFLTTAGTGASDYIGCPVTIRDTTGTVANYHFRMCSFLGGPGQTNNKSWTPAFWIAPGQDGHGNTNISTIYLTLDKTFWNCRGIVWSVAGGGVKFVADWYYRQGGIMPVMMVQGSQWVGDFRIQNLTLDTEGQPVIANITGAGISTTASILNSTNGTGNPLVTGTRLDFLKTSPVEYSPAGQVQNRDSVIEGAVGSMVVAPFATSGTFAAIASGLSTFLQPVHLPSGNSLYFDLPAPTNVAGTVGSGGSIPVGGFYYIVTAVGADFGETICSAPSALITTTSGNQTVNLTWTAVPSAISYNVYRAPSSPNPILWDGTANVTTVTWFRLALHNVAASFSDTLISATNFAPPTATGTGSTVVNKTGVYAPILVASGSTPTGLAGQLSLGTTQGVGNGSAGNLQAPAQATGSGPASLTAVNWLQIDIAGTKYWTPLCQ